MIKLACFDIDGTLYDTNNKVVHDSTIKIIKDLKTIGIKFAIATGRTHYAIEKSILDLNPDYIVACNGHIVVNSNGEIISCVNLEKVDVDGIYNLSLKYKLPLILKYEDKCNMYQYATEFIWYKRIEGYQELFRFEKNNYIRHLSEFPQNLIVKCENNIKKEIKKLYPNLEFIQAISDEYDVVLKGVNKSVGIEFILNELNINWDNVFTIGDNINDIEMIKKAKYGSAVGGANIIVKQAAKYISPNIEEDGISQLLTEILINLI